VSTVEDRVQRIMEAHWRDPGYTVPNPDVYPAQFLWDSCFHAVIWRTLGRPERALTELRNLFTHQTADGFVAHMTYWSDPDRHADFWGHRHTSAVTQPPMYGHALADLVRAGVAVDEELIDRAEAGLRFLVERRSRDGVVAIVHPWESGCDDSPRWDSWCPGGWTAARWKAIKGELVASLAFDGDSPVGNPSFEVGAAGFNALVVFNVVELAVAAGRSLHPSLTAFVDDYVPTFDDVGGRASSDVATSEALLAALVDDAAADDALTRLGTSFRADFGPTTVARSEPAYDPTAYWRGPAWPQLTYLFWLAARRAGRVDDAASLASALVRGAARSGFAEYWHPDDGTGLGARPQSWTGLAAVVSAR
jgi:hypothetical protein